MDRPVVVTPQKVVEALMIVRDEQRAKVGKYLDKKIPCGQSNCHCLTWLISGGSIYDPEKEAARYIPYIEAVRKALPEYNTYVETQACSPKSAEKLAKAGLHGIQYNIEVWNKKMFYVTCPGKAKNITWEKWTEWLAGAVPFYERGHVVSNQVLGLELQPPEGFKDLEQGFESVMEGQEWFARHGIAPSWTPFVTYTGTKIENAPCPPTEYYLRVGIATHDLMLEHRLYTPSRFFFCYRGGIIMGSCDFARLRWDEGVKYNEYRDPCMQRQEEAKSVLAP
ncbi:MAG: hypothetical protein QF619_08465 [Candidatus Binatia bacterium]|nr:hypothetical protein [Candidatus Binatia bacterium]